ncbi:hypothetical protein PR202_ga10715 [Eleusine coracana subsp. coracana]|uniref:Chromatin modification-related protein EAF1 B n=1 Tax=Eleusine coracana subsp. coracana TaxID=191504 RepID=A0AAV5C7E5_ELECO|nr:hypothetical protein PR202_ga10715 [Eleusine coracana subsp. coracana]
MLRGGVGERIECSLPEGWRCLRRCFCGPEATELCSMGGIAECGLSVDTKASPRRAAIEKAQEELRCIKWKTMQEYDVREERRRELEFLEKGGNPLDFKLGYVASLSVQSTSVESSGKIAEQNVISEAKGSFAVATSPYGDSVESSGKPGNSLCREGTTDDNLMLLDGDTNNIGGEKTVKHGTKRTNIAQPDQFLHNDGHSNAKEGEDPGFFRLGPKSQANVATELNISQTAHEDNERSKNESTNTNIVCQNMEISANNVPDNLHLTEGGHMAATTPAGSPDPVSKEAASRTLCSLTSISNEILRESQSPEKADNSLSVANAVDVLADGVDNKGADPHSAVDNANVNESEMDLTCAHDTKDVDEHPGKNENLVPVKPCETADEGLNKILSVDMDAKKDGDLEVSSKPDVVDESSTSVQPEVSSSIYVNDEKEVSNNAVDAQKDTDHLATLGHDNGSREECSDLGENSNCRTEASIAHNFASVTMPPATSACNMTNPVPLVENLASDTNIDAEKSNGDQTKITKKELDDSIVARKEYEDSVIRKARFIEANIKKAGERSLCNIITEKKRKSHWDFVLEEMTWMATDFMQERLWKSAAAAQMSHCISSTGRAAFEEASIQRKQKSVARTLARYVMNFWRSVGSLQSGTDMPKPMPRDQTNGLEEKKFAEVKAEKQQDDESLGLDKSWRSSLSPIQSYALRLLKDNSKASECLSLAEAPPTPERLNDFGILIVPDQLSKANLFYEVAPGAMQAYRESVEFRYVHNRVRRYAHYSEKYNDSSLHLCVDVPMGNAYGDDEGDMRPYLSSGHYDGGLASKLSHKKKHPLQQRMNGTRQYETGGDMPYEPFLESKSGNQQFLSNGKRTADFLSVPTKRIRTAVRQRVVSPFPSGVAGTSQFTSKTDASSGDTNSYQDDQSSFGGSFPRKNADIESTMDFDRQLLYDGNEVSTKSKKKKKSKHQGYKTPQTVAESCTFTARGKGAYDARPQAVSVAQYDQSLMIPFSFTYQKDYLKKRSEVHQFDSNGNIVINGQHAAKKPKLMNQLPDISLEALAPVGPMASPAASQMSNMANPTKIIKITTRGRKTKGLKMTAGHVGPGGPWSSFEDQALVVLVHDLGENWELVSDALNNIVQLKCIYRRPNECEERHKFLTDKGSGDGADSADDSGSSQRYPSQLPGIPKGSARQLFQRLQVPFEDENIKAHFEKIIVLGQKLHQNRQKDSILVLV